jgi:hypothetical protein
MESAAHQPEVSNAYVFDSTTAQVNLIRSIQASLASEA